jgi:hypothetical protein
MRKKQGKKRRPCGPLDCGAVVNWVQGLKRLKKYYRKTKETKGTEETKEILQED